MAQLCIAQFKGAFIVDIVFFVLLFVLALVDAHRGFIACFFSFVSTIVAGLIALFFASGFQRLTGGLFGLQGAIGNGIGNLLSGTAGFNVDVSAGGVEAALSAVGLPQFIKDAILQVVGAATDGLPAGTTLGMLTGNVIGKFIVTLICAVALFFLVKLLMRLLKGIFERIADSMTAIRKINRLLGMFVGVFKAFAITCVIFAVLALFPNEGMTAFFNETILLSGLYNNNPIFVIFGLFFA